MDIEVYQTVTETDGTISAYVRFKDDSGAVLKQTCIQGKTQADFETAISEYSARVELEMAEKTTGIAMVLGAINKIKETGEV